MMHTKGAAWLSAYEYLKQNFDEGDLERVRAGLAEADRLALSKPILPVTWVDYGAFIRFQLAVDAQLGRGDRAVVVATSRYSAHKDLSGIYRMFVSLSGPKLVMKSAALVWRQYYDQGHSTVESAGNSCVTRITECPDIPLNHEYDNGPWMQTALELSGCTQVVWEHPECIAHGDARCTFTLRWAGK